MGVYRGIQGCVGVYRGIEAYKDYIRAYRVVQGLSGAIHRGFRSRASRCGALGSGLKFRDQELGF